MCWSGWLAVSWSGMNSVGMTGAAPFCSIDFLSCIRLTQAHAPDDGRGQEWVSSHAQAFFRTVFASYLLVSTGQGKSQGQTCFGSEACAMIGPRFCFLRVVPSPLFSTALVSAIWDVLIFVFLLGHFWKRFGRCTLWTNFSTCFLYLE